MSRHGLSLIPAALLAGIAPAAAHPVVVELFQSQGCSSCPPANHNLNLLATQGRVIALNFAVTYWDRLGWKDTFASPAYTARQWDYARAGGRGNVATPQVVINGKRVINGGDEPQLAAAIAAARADPAGPAIVVRDGRVSIGAGPTAVPATVWLVRYDPRTLNVAIRAGENGGRTLPHRNVVRSLSALGSWRGRAVSFALPGGSPYPSTILIQAGSGGPIVGAAAL